MVSVGEVGCQWKREGEGGNVVGMVGGGDGLEGADEESGEAGWGHGGLWRAGSGARSEDSEE